MEHNFTPQEICEFGQRMAMENIISTFAPRSHSHGARILFPQTLAQFSWLKSYCGTTYNCVILYPVARVAEVVPELSKYLVPTKSKNYCRIDLTL